MPSDISFWIRFFEDAGLPSGVSANYAVTFSDNRIKMDMLLDLNKEYLRDMGITAMGDVIAILRHSNMVHRKSSKVSDSKSHKNSSARRAASPRRTSPRETPPITRRTPSMTRRTPPKSSSPLVYRRRVSPRGKMSTPSTSPSPPPVHSSVSKPSTLHVSGGSKRKYSNEPKGTKVRVIAEEKSISVHKRLGERLGEVSSTTDEPSSSFTGRQVVRMVQYTPPVISKSVFDRLGDKTVSSSTETKGPPLDYHGVFKYASEKKKNNTMVADKTSRPSAPRSIKARLGKTAPPKKPAATVRAQPKVEKPAYPFTQSLGRPAPKCHNNGGCGAVKLLHNKKNVSLIERIKRSLSSDVENEKVSVKARLGRTSTKTHRSSPYQSFSRTSSSYSSMRPYPEARSRNTSKKSVFSRLGV